MQFTPQQLAGAQRYGSNTRIGNWLEDCKLKETKIAEFCEAKESGRLTMANRNAKMMACNQEVALSAGSTIKFGDTIALAHVPSGGMLANDCWEEMVLGQEEYLVSVGSGSMPVARNTFTIEPVATRLKEAIAYEDGEELSYGQPFHLKCNAALGKGDLYLASAQHTPHRGSRITNHQAVFMSTVCDNNAVWIIHHVSDVGIKTGATRLLALGESVPSNTPIVLLHRATGQSLYCNDGVSESTEFGLEFEVCANSSKAPNKCESLVAEAKGTMTASTNVRAELASNQWMVAMA